MDQLPEGSQWEVLEEVKRYHDFIPKRGNFIPIKRRKMMIPKSEATWDYTALLSHQIAALARVTLAEKQARAVSGQERMGSGAKMKGFALEAGQVLLETVEEVECTCPDAGGWEVVVVDGSL